MMRIIAHCACCENLVMQALDVRTLTLNLERNHPVRLNCDLCGHRWDARQREMQAIHRVLRKLMESAPLPRISTR